MGYLMETGEVRGWEARGQQTCEGREGEGAATGFKARQADWRIRKGQHVGWEGAEDGMNMRRGALRVERIAEWSAPI